MELTEEQKINKQIQDAKGGKSKLSPFNTNLISDGYHTFGELYEHRIELWITLCRTYAEEFSNGYDVWKTNIKDGWFILGINKEKGEQMTYHLPESKWKETEFAEVLESDGYEFDGHTSADVLERLKQL